MTLVDELQGKPMKIIMIGYLDKSEDHPSRLDVGFDNGVEYQIEGVPRDLYEKFDKSPMKSTFFTTEIFTQYKDKIKVIKPE